MGDGYNIRVAANRYRISSMLKEIRESRGLSQEELSTMLNVSRTTISKIENGKFSYSIDYLSKFSIILEFDISLKKVEANQQ